MPQPSGMPAATMLGFGQSPAPPYYAPAPGPVDPSQQQRLQQYYSTGMYHQQQPQQLPPLSQATLNSASLKDPTSTRRSGKVKFFDTQKVGFPAYRPFYPSTLMAILTALQDSGAGHAYKDRGPGALNYFNFPAFFFNTCRGSALSMTIGQKSLGMRKVSKGCMIAAAYSGGAPS